MTQPNRCPECGAELPAGAPEGLCPKCLMAAGLESRTDPSQPAGSGSEAPTTPHSAGFVPPAPSSLAVHFPQLEILELLGHGGMGAVYKARQPKLDRLVALKIIRPESADYPAFAERFNREARMLARLSHPQIVAVYDFGEVTVTDAGEEQGGPRRLYFFLMEYVEGANLRQLMQGGELTPEQALAIVPQICEALQFAHDEGVVHRDIKPENILLDKRGRVKIADFGLAKLAAGSPEEFTLTGTHQVMGTPRYMAPEQMEGSRAVDHRADIFSLGVVFYEMLTGEIPAGHFEPPSKKVEVDVRLDEVVLRALAREPERRYQHASDVKSDVELISTTGSVWAASYSPPRERRQEPSTAEVLRQIVWGWSGWRMFLVVLIGALSLTVLLTFTQPSDAAWAIGMAVLFLSFLVMAVLYPGTTRGLQGVAGLLGVSTGLLIYWAFVPQPLLNWVYRISGVTPSDGDSAFVRLLIGCLVAWLIWQMVQLRRKLKEPEQVGRSSAPEPQRRYQHASEVKLEVESISSTLTPAQTAAPSEVAEEDAMIENAEEVLKFPAIALLVVAIFLSLWTALGLIPFTVWFWFPAGSEVGFSSVLLLMVACAGLVVGPILMIIGAVKMLRLSSYQWALAAGLLAVMPIPSGPLWLFSLPLGIWALAMLSKPEVKRGFALRKQEAVHGRDGKNSSNEPERRYQQASEVKADVESIPREGRSPDPLSVRTWPPRETLPPGIGPRMLLFSGAMLFSALIIAAGIALLIIGVLRESPASGEFWGWLGGAFGCLIGGAGGLVGTWNSYRQWEGAPDLWEEPNRTWFDRAMAGYTAVGLLAMAAALILTGWLPWYPVCYGLMLLGGIVAFQGVLFLVIRGLTRRAAQQERLAQQTKDESATINKR